MKIPLSYQERGLGVEVVATNKIYELISTLFSW
jgi:hypothetical protein